MCSSDLDEFRQRERGDTLTGPGFADERQRLAGLDGERHTIHRAHFTVVGEEADLQISNAEKLVFSWHDVN